MFRPVHRLGSQPPRPVPENQNKYEEKDPDNLEEQDASHAPKRPQESAHSPRQAAGSAARGPPRGTARGGPGHALNGHGAASRRLAAPRQPLPGNAPGNAHPNSQYPADGLRFHSRL